MNKDCFYKLQKSIYGLHQALRNSYQTKVIVNHGFQQSKADHSMCLLQKTTVYIVVLIYVDDVLLLGNDGGKINDVKEYLKSHFSIKDLGVLKYFLGIEVARSEEGFF